MNGPTESPARLALAGAMLAGVASQYAAAITQGLVGLVVLTLLARLLDPADFGVVGIATAILGVAVAVAQFGLRPAIVRRPALGAHDIETGFTLALLSGASTTLLLWLAAPLLADAFRNAGVTPILRGLSLTPLLESPGYIAGALLERELAWRKLLHANVISSAASGAVGIGMALSGFNAWALVGMELAAVLARTLLLLRARPHPKRLAFDGVRMREFARFGGGFTLARIFHIGASQADNVIVGRMLGATALGFYGRAFALMMLPVSYFAMLIAAALFPVMSRIHRDSHQLRASYLTSSAAIGLGSGPLSALMVVTAPELVHVLLGPKWSPAILPLQILSLSVFFRSGFQTAYCLDGALGAMSKRAFRTALYLAAVVAGSVVGSRFGLPGVATGVLAATVLGFVMGAATSVALIGSTWPAYLKTQAPGILLGFVTAAVALPTRHALQVVELPALVVLLITVLLSAGAVGTLLVVFPRVAGNHGILALRLLVSALATKLPARGRARITSLVGGFTRQLQGTRGSDVAAKRMLD